MSEFRNVLKKRHLQVSVEKKKVTVCERSTSTDCKVYLNSMEMERVETFKYCTEGVLQARMVVWKARWKKREAG